MSDPLSPLYRGFRERYLPFDELEAQLMAWAEAFPEIARLESIGETPEGRDLWVISIGPGGEDEASAVWVDGNMHAGELAGSSVALAIAEDALRLHLAPDAEQHGLAARTRRSLRAVTFHVLPRMSPDGAEVVLQTGRLVRSTPRDERPDRHPARWVGGDVDGDGVALLMRVEDPTGEFTERDDLPGVLRLRRLEDEGPFYKLYPEGHIERFDGHYVPSPSYLSETDVDLNRNFPYDWRPQFEQAGAGISAASAPESRAVVEWTSARPQIFAWLNLHCFGGVYIRPSGYHPDAKMDPSDLALFRQLGEWAEALTPYPMVSGFEEFTYEPDKPLHGDEVAYAFNQRGAVAYVCELWDIFARLGMERPKRFVDHYASMTDADVAKLAEWDRAENKGRLFRPWRAFEHPQLGPVEIGGLDPRFGLWNPPPEALAEVCRHQSAFFMRTAALAPELRVDVSREAVAEGVTQLAVAVENHGYLPTYVLASAKKLDWNEPVYLEASVEGGCSLLEPSHARQTVGHLDGWGRGKRDGSGMPALMWGRGTTGRRRLTLAVKGSGVVRLRVGSCRVGFTEQAIEV